MMILKNLNKKLKELIHLYKVLVQLINLNKTIRFLIFIKDIAKFFKNHKKITASLILYCY